MADLYGRTWEIVVDGLALDGFDVAFQVERDTTPSPNKSDLAIFNLSPALRDRISSAKTPEVQISAGYGDHNGVIYRGQAREVVHTRTQTDWETRLSCGDSERALQRAVSNRSYAKGTQVYLVVGDLLRDLGISDTAGALREFGAAVGGRTFQQGTVLEGPAAQSLTYLLEGYGFGWSVQNGVLVVARFGTPSAPQAVLLSAGTGLIEPSPTLSAKGELKASALMHPDIAPGGVVVIESQAVAGAFRVEKVTFVGDTAGNDWRTDIEGRTV